LVAAGDLAACEELMHDPGDRQEALEITGVPLKVTLEPLRRAWTVHPDRSDPVAVQDFE
jgi:hypothetical protein